MNIENKLYVAAKSLIEKRYPGQEGGAAAMRTESGKVLTSISPDTKNDALSLCMEVGACLEAHKLNERVTHSLCLYRKVNSEEFFILTPCGICQERLVFWGGDVKVAISNCENEIIFKPLKSLLLHHWSLINGEIL